MELYLIFKHITFLSLFCFPELASRLGVRCAASDRNLQSLTSNDCKHEGNIYKDLFGFLHFFAERGHLFRHMNLGGTVYYQARR